jgi:hypothetical protein
MDDPAARSVADVLALYRAISGACSSCSPP